MNRNDFEITRSDYLYALKYGEIDNSDFAIEFFERIKNKCEIDIKLCRYMHFKGRQGQFEEEIVLQCYIVNGEQKPLSEILTESAEGIIFSIFDDMIQRYDVCLGDILGINRKIIPVDFTCEARKFLIEHSCETTEKLLYRQFNFDTIVLPTITKEGIPTHIIAFKYSDDKKRFISETLPEFQKKFLDYLQKKDHWKVFDNIAYNPQVCMSSDLNEGQRYYILHSRKR